MKIFNKLKKNITTNPPFPVFDITHTPYGIKYVIKHYLYIYGTKVGQRVFLYEYFLTDMNNFRYNPFLPSIHKSNTHIIRFDMPDLITTITHNFRVFTIFGLLSILLMMKLIMANINALIKLYLVVVFTMCHW